MVVESLFHPISAEKKPMRLFFIGFLYSSIAVFLSLWIFENQASFIMVFLIVIACVPLLYNTIKLEESKDMVIVGRRKLLREHGKAIKFLMFLFLGITLSSVLWYTVLPREVVNTLFDKQTKTISEINNNVSGNATTQVGRFFKIFFNNLKVLSFAILFALVYGTGAIFILTWNATIIGTAMGNFIRQNLASYAGTFGAVNIASYFQVVSLGILRYMIHGIPEIMAYFYGGLAGGIISVSVIRHHYTSKKFLTIVEDSADLVMLSIFLLVVGALLEVYITPILF